MAFEPVKAQAGACWATISALTNADGSATHPCLQMLARVRTPARMLADSIHLIGMLHGRHPGVIDHAFAHAAQPAASGWLEAAAEGFAQERSYLTRLTSAAGPMPSTPGQAESEAAVAAQRHALDMLAQSDRTGCSTGAAIALVLDWMTIRTMLDSAAERFGVATVACALPDIGETMTVVAALSSTPAVERAMAFGVQQVIAQQRGLWDLIEARASARGDI